MQPQSHPQGARTPDWPAQPATKPQAPRARPPKAPVTLEPDSSVETKINKKKIQKKKNNTQKKEYKKKKRTKKKNTKKKNTKKKEIQKKRGGDREGTPRTTKLLIRLTTPRQQSNKHAANMLDNNACTQQEYR